MKNFHPTGNCPVRDVISRLGDKWSMLVLITLNANGTMRFSDIHKTIEDISQRMLTVTLRTLESDGLIERKIYAGSTSPCRVLSDRYRRNFDSAY
ncbi:helix-turn-helix transcriptional regulator [Bacteroides thetaiotaomicron]|nr:helix-turn-helix transcriptional regulator [Bacteroides thetaiotaomicron]